MENPTVSVIIDNYNYASFLNDSIESVLHQTYPRIEIIVVDDGSSDSSSQILTKFIHFPNIKVYYKENGGQASAFNMGVAHANGEIISFLDSDDYFLPYKIEQSVNVLIKNPEAGWMCHPLIWEFLDGETRQNIDFGKLVQVRDFRRDFRKGAIKHPFSATSGLCFRKDLIEKIFPIPDDIRITADNYIKYSAAALSPVVFLNNCLSIQRIHKKNAFTLNPNALILSIEIHIAIAKYLRQRIPGSKSFSFRLAGRQVGLVMEALGCKIAVRKAIKASEDLNLSDSLGPLALLTWGLISTIKRRLTIKKIF
jgi:glycosyltransferase involved in cell wall biosynthesis